MKKILIYLSFLLWIAFNISYAVPNFNNQWKDIGYNISEVWKWAELKDNIMNLFFPRSSWNQWWIIWDKLLVVAVWLLFLFLIRSWALFVLWADDDGELKKAKLNLVYILYWAFLIFASVWLLWNILHVWWNTQASDVLIHTQRDIIWNILIFLKSIAYFLALIMMVYYWYQIIQAQEKEDKIKAWKNGVLNIILALIAIKVLDYVYYIAQTSNFKNKAWDLISSSAKVLWWILWVIIILAIIYSAILLFTSKWNEESWKKAKTIIRNVFIVILVIFLFIVILYDLIKNFSA